MSDSNAVKIDFALSPMFDFVLEANRGLRGNEIKNVFDSDPDYAEVEDPVKSFFNEHAARRFEKSAGNHSDSSWDLPVSEPVPVVKYDVGGQLLGKSELTSRMLSVLNNIKSFCIGNEAELIEKSVRALDFSLFGQLCEPVLARMNDAIRSA